ncbi:bifunctional biotin--[acetyl-CoA-carboxylase] synthetase/biotin operon repressor [Aliidiomarina minuta]|uniref:Bifunctional ligase/repressor BirA n=1 Tax=Aliidiomarina minuta TaxID=880057 RepID=A0A432W117_9GAMM|nr:bifunctional biotin--[acetyl-CoA-carboxylase] ligase/biotin operon repressor BirA [Aliidiomarina minuta]RUO22919.1 bifunctional biotin--[acetyl-CoA-carboxylase] synthetase/biotin operon repressor [Aliidiomarina minuta]
MKSSTQHIENTLIETLADGEFHSGQQLAERLQISRSAIHKRIASLDKLNLDIFRVQGRGYKLAEPLELLNSEKLQDALRDSSLPAPLSLRRITGSTNDDLRGLLQEAQQNRRTLAPGTAVIAEMQTAGRGRRGKAWLSPFGANLYMSMYWPLSQGLNGALGLSVAIGVCLAQMLQRQGIAGVSVKWPNDVYVQGSKIAGILIELEGQPAGEGHALIGIGLNIKMPDRHKSEIEQAFTDVQSHIEGPVRRHVWAAHLINGCREALLNYDANGLQNLIKDWRELDHFYMQPVRLLLGQHEQQGVAEGIDENGALLVRQEGKLKSYFGGEISLRAAL